MTCISSLNVMIVTNVCFSLVTNLRNLSPASNNSVGAHKKMATKRNIIARCARKNLGRPIMPNEIKSIISPYHDRITHNGGTVAQMGHDGFTAHLDKAILLI